MSDEEQADEIWLTTNLPPCAGFKAALEILGVGRMTLSRWMRPGSGTQGPEKTYMLPAARIDSGPFWATEDIERWALKYGRQRAPSGASESPAASV